MLAVRDENKVWTLRAGYPAAGTLPVWLTPYVDPGPPMILRLPALGTPELFYTCEHDRLTVSRDLQALRRRARATTLSLRSLASYLRHGFVPLPMTLWDDIHALGYGSSLVNRGASWRVVSSFRYRGFTRQDEPFDARTLYEVLSSVVSVSIGRCDGCAVSLSSGIDSLTLTEIARHQVALTSYSFRDPGAPALDESRIAVHAAQHLGIPARVVDFPKAHWLEDLARLSRATNLPTADPVLLAQYWIAQAVAAEGEACVLLGDGAESLFGDFYLRPDLHGPDPEDRREFIWFGYPLHCNEAQLQALLAPPLRGESALLVERERAEWRALQRAHVSDALWGLAFYDHEHWMPGNVFRRDAVVQRLTGVRALYPYYRLEHDRSFDGRLPLLPRPRVYELPKLLLRRVMAPYLGPFAMMPTRGFTLAVGSWLDRAQPTADELLGSLEELTDGMLANQSLSSLQCAHHHPRTAYSLVSLSTYLREHSGT